MIWLGLKFWTWTVTSRNKVNNDVIPLSSAVIKTSTTVEQGIWNFIGNNLGWSHGFQLYCDSFFIPRERERFQTVKHQRAWRVTTEISTCQYDVESTWGVPWGRPYCPWRDDVAMFFPCELCSTIFSPRWATPCALYRMVLILAVRCLIRAFSAFGTSQLPPKLGQNTFCE